MQLAVLPPFAPLQVQEAEPPTPGNDGVDPERVPVEQNAEPDVEGQEFVVAGYVCRLEPHAALVGGTQLDPSQLYPELQ
jgi:hypothetical protein